MCRYRGNLTELFTDHIISLNQDHPFGENENNVQN